MRSLTYRSPPNTNFSKFRDWYFSSIFHLDLAETGWNFRIPASLCFLLIALLRSEENGRNCRFCSGDRGNPHPPAAPPPPKACTGLVGPEFPIQNNIRTSKRHYV